MCVCVCVCEYMYIRDVFGVRAKSVAKNVAKKFRPLRGQNGQNSPFGHVVGDDENG